MDTLDENAMIDLIPVENNESMADASEEVITKSARKTPHRQRQTGIMQFFLQKRMNKFVIGRESDLSIIDLKLFF